MTRSIDIINLDNSYIDQTFYKNFNYNIFDLTDIKGVTYFCSLETLDELRSRLSEVDIKNFKYLGSGNYHYITYLILEKIREEFSLILFDHHVEMLKSNYGGLVSCGSWLLNVLEENENIREVYLIGVSEKYIDIIPKKYLKEKNLIIITEEDIKKNREYLLKIRPKYKTYITIDKDVFRTSLAKTNWDQGTMTLLDFEMIIKSLEKTILGVDICGEDDLKNQDIFNKARLESIRKNNKINHEIIKILNKKINK